MKENEVPKGVHWEGLSETDDPINLMYKEIYNTAVELADNQRGKFGLNKKETQKLIPEHINNMIRLTMYISAMGLDEE